MRTAEEIYESNVQYERNGVSEMLKKSILSAIITAQKEAIEECAELATNLNSFGKQKILSLINELK